LFVPFQGLLAAGGGFGQEDVSIGAVGADGQGVFEFLILEGAQAGLSWETILKKRPNYRQAFDNFDPAIVAKYGSKKRWVELTEPIIMKAGEAFVAVTEF
jgi:3-methyladenine DNA glycosylase Tag